MYGVIMAGRVVSADNEAASTVPKDMENRFDVVIIGGGAMGSAVAHYLSEGGGIAVAVVERDPTYARASSALSASSIRQQFSTPANIALSRFGLEIMRDPTTHLSVDGEGVDLGFHEMGYLYLASAAGEDVIRHNHALQRSLGVDVMLETPDQLTARFPWISVEDITLGSFGLSGEGWFDGYSLLQAYRRKARSQGVTYIPASAVTIGKADSRVTSVTLDDGRHLSCGAVVNAAGPWAGAVAGMAGVMLPVTARKRCVFVVSCRDRLENVPLLIDTSGIWVRPEGRQFLVGGPPPADRDGHGDDLTVEHDLFEDIMWPALANRIPAFEALRVTASWAGFYEYNEVDQNAVIGAHPDLSNFYFINGFSGHGLQQAPGAGRGLAELIRYGDYRKLDLSVFSYDRLRDGRPLLETAII